MKAGSLTGTTTHGTHCRSLATLVLAAGDFGRPYVMPPNTPAEHVKTIREAFAKTLNDEAVKADAAKKSDHLHSSEFRTYPPITPV
jgi:hypothetical protein